MDYNNLILDLLARDSPLTHLQRLQNEQFEKVMLFFDQEQDQVTELLTILMACKFKHPVGMTVDQITYYLRIKGSYHLFRSKAYLCSLINSLSLFGMIELHVNTNNINITTSGVQLIDKWIRR